MTINDKQTGAWIKNDSGTFGLIDAGLSGTKSAYVCFYPEGKSNCHAISVVEGECILQVACPKTGAVKQYPMSKVSELLHLAEGVLKLEAAELSHVPE